MIDDNTGQRVIEDVRTAARALPPGSRLTSVRELMARHRASPVTVQGAIARLAQEGLVVPRPGRGTFVAERAPVDDDPPDLSWQAVALGTARSDGAGLGELLLVEAPTYLGALVAARAAQLRVVPVPTDADGIRPALLAEAFERSGARLLYAQPTFANPHGATLGPGRRAAVLDVVATAG